MNIPLTALILSFVTAGSCLAQEVAFPVTDLLQPTPEAAPARAQPRTWIRRIAELDQEYRRRSIIGEAQFFELGLEQRERTAFSGDSLPLVVAQLTELDIEELSIYATDYGTELIAPASAAHRVEMSLDWIRSQLPPKITLDVRLDRIANGSTTTLLGGRETVSDGAQLVLADVAERSVLYDFNVEIAQASMMATPITATATTGTSLVMRARPTPDHARAVIETVVRTARPSGAAASIDLQHSGFGALDRVAQDFTENATSFVLARGGTAVQEWTGPAGATMRLTTSARWEVPRAVPTDRPDVTVRASALLNGEIQNFRTVHADADQQEIGVDRRLASLADAMLQGGDANGVMFWDASSERRAGFLMLGGQTAAAIDASVTRAAANALSSFQLTLEVLDTPMSASVTPTGERPADARTVTRIVTPMIAGPSVCFTGMSETSYVAQWQSEVAQAARVPDPMIRWVEDGYAANLRALTDASGAVQSIELDLELTRLEELTRQVIPLDVEVDTPESVTVTGSSRNVSGSLLHATTLKQDIVALEKPTVHRSRIISRVALDEDGTATIERTATGFTGEGRKIAITVRVDRQ